MNPIDFKESNKNLLKPSNMTDEECSSLNVYTDGNQCISCWKSGFWGRIKFLMTGKMWLSIYSGQTQPPVWVSPNNPFIVEKNNNGK